jgi:hypothetical protein
VPEDFARKGNEVTTAIDDLLGRTLLFREDGYTIKAAVTIVARDPARGWKLSAPGYTQAWVSDLMMSALLTSGVLVP